MVVFVDVMTDRFWFYVYLFQLALYCLSISWFIFPRNYKGTQERSFNKYGRVESKMYINMQSSIDVHLPPGQKHAGFCTNSRCLYMFRRNTLQAFAIQGASMTFRFRKTSWNWNACLPCRRSVQLRNMQSVRLTFLYLTKGLLCFCLCSDMGVPNKIKHASVFRRMAWPNK